MTALLFRGASNFAPGCAGRRTSAGAQWWAVSGLLLITLAGCRCTCPPRPPSVADGGPPALSRAAGSREVPATDAPSSIASPRAASRKGSAKDAGASGRARNDAREAGGEERSFRERFDDAKVLAVLEGKAAYYSDALAGRKTASGEPYDPQAFTAAHRSLPFGTIVRVIRLEPEATTYVRINDRGPFGDARRIIDLSKIAARRLDMLDAGVVRVRLEVVKRGGD